MRIVEILIAINALCGIAAFLIARGLWNRGVQRFRELIDPDDDPGNPDKKELPP